MSLRILALTFFDPASVVLSHRHLMRNAGHDFRLASVRAYTERQRQADWLCEQLTQTSMSPDGLTKALSFARLDPDLGSLREFAESCDIVQFHFGIGRGDGDWASRTDSPMRIAVEIADILQRFGLPGMPQKVRVAFTHGSNSTRRNLTSYRDLLKSLGMRFAASTLDYATDLDAAYLPPLVDLPLIDGVPLQARLRGDDDPLVIAHTPTDRIACSTEAFREAARSVGALVLMGEGLKHEDAMALKAQAFAGFDHLRGAFSTNTLENAAVGLAPLFMLTDGYAKRFETECADDVICSLAEDCRRFGLVTLLRHVTNTSANRRLQEAASAWWRQYFSAEPITRRLVSFYEGL